MCKILTNCFILSKDEINQTPFDLVRQKQIAADYQLQNSIDAHKQKDARPIRVYSKNWVLDEPWEDVFRYTKTVYLFLTNPDDARTPDELVWLPELASSPSNPIPSERYVSKNGKVFCPVGANGLLWKLVDEQNVLQQTHEKTFEQRVYFLDAEFIEDSQKRAIDLISIGIVAEDGREYYACNDECDLSKANDWVKANVLPNLPAKHIGVNPGDPDVSPLVRQDILRWKTLDAIAKDILEFCSPEKYGNPIFWGEWSSCDWVAFCWIFGDMIDLPKGFPMRCRDVIQWAEDHLGIDAEELPPSMETEGKHDALLGALSVRRRWMYCWEIEATRETSKDALCSSISEKIERAKHLLEGGGVGATLKELDAIALELERLAKA